MGCYTGTLCSQRVSHRFLDKGQRESRKTRPYYSSWRHRFPCLNIQWYIHYNQYEQGSWKMKIILGIDNGTQSTKTLFYDVERRQVVALASAKHDLIAKEDGTREQHPHWWITALQSALSQVDPELRRKVEAVGVSGQQHGLVPIDEEGEALYQAKLWCDTTTVDECDTITSGFGGEAKLLSETGNLIVPGYTAGKILWLKNHKAELFKKMRWVLLPHDYLNYWLTGRVAMEYGDASGTGLLDIRRRRWHYPLIQSIDPSLGERLPELIEPDGKVGEVSVDAARLTGLPVGVPVSSGGGDNMMGALGTGAVRDGVIAMSMGTSGTLYGFSKTPIIDPEGILAAFCSSTGGWLPLLCTMNCTVATELTRELFGMSIEEITIAGAESPVGANGVSMLPFFNGERVPPLPSGKASIMGLTTGNYTRENIARASLESAVYGMRIGLDRFRELGFDVREIRITGGGAKSPIWRQMAADVLGTPVLVPQQAESAAFGAALQAFWMLEGGGEDRLNALVREHVSINRDESCEPNPGVSVEYGQGYNRYREWLAQLESMYSR